MLGETEFPRKFIPPWVQAAGRVAVGGDAYKKTGGGGSTTDSGGSSAANTLVPNILLLIFASIFI